MKKKSGTSASKQPKGASNTILIIILSIAVIVLLGFAFITLKDKDDSAAAGKAISGIERARLSDFTNITDGSVFINPTFGLAGIKSVNSTLLGEEFSIEVYIKPTLAQVSPNFQTNPKFNNYKFDVTFPEEVEFNSAVNLVSGKSWKLSASKDLKKVTIVAEATDLSEGFGKSLTPLAELRFKPKNYLIQTTPKENVLVSNFENVNSYGLDGAAAKIATTYKGMILFVGLRVFKDNDADQYGTAIDNKIVSPSAIPTSYVAADGDCNDLDSSIHPAALEICDGIDTNCAAGITDEILPSCQELNAECGIHRVCSNSRYVDCNLGATPTTYLNGTEKCGSGKLCSDGGQCISAVTTITQLIPLVATPSCGDAICQYYEHILTCPQDCTTCPAGITSCVSPDADGDGLSDVYESSLETQMQAKGFLPTIGFNSQDADSDNDGVNDTSDYCPGTDNPAGIYTLNNGRINFNGCYSGDVATEGAGIRPDGIYSLKDTTVAIDYYLGREQGNSNLKR